LALRQQFTIHGDVLERVEVYKYLGRMMAQDDNDAQAICAQLWKARATGLGLERFFGEKTSPRPLPQNSTWLWYKPSSYTAARRGHLPAGNGPIGGVQHQGCLAHGAETQTAARPLEGVGLPKIRGCFEGMRDEDDSRVRSDPPADDPGVHCN
jgi:hypothetical protein